MPAPTPTATARLATMSLGRLLVYALERRANGTLVIESPEGHRSAIYFEGGVAAKARSGQPVHLLGELLVERGLLAPTALADALVRAPLERQLLGQWLVRGGLLSRTDLAETMREQLQRKIGWMGALPAASIAGFYDQVNLLERWGAVEHFPIGPLHLLWKVVRDHGDAEPVAGTLAKLGNRILKLHREAQLASFRLEREEQALIDVMRARPAPVAELVTCGVLPPERAQRLVYVLGLTRQLDLGSALPPPLGAGEPSSRGSSATSRRTPPRRVTSSTRTSEVELLRRSSEPDRGRGASEPSPPGAPLSAELAAFAEEIRTRAEQQPGQTLYEILGVDATATALVIQGAFFQLARRWHPDRLPVELLSLKAVATGVFARMTEAHGQLTDPGRRAEYDRLLAEGGGTAEERERINTILHAANAFQRAEILIKRQRLVEAEQEAKIAAEGDPEQAEYAALHAWLKGQRTAREDAAGLAACLKVLDGAVAKEPDHVRIRLYRAQLQKRAGREDLAIRDYRRVVELQPTHTDALRELRLHQMRRGERGQGTSSRPPADGKPAAPAGGSPGFLGKLFKR